MKRLWTEDEVTHHGRHWQLDGVRPHLHPVQDPHPPIWIGAQALAGVRRAAKYGDGYACSPETPMHEIAERHQVVMDGFAERGKEFTPQPLRRNGMVADTREEARSEFARVAQGRYVTYAQKGFDAMDLGDLERDFLDTVADHAVIGTPDDVVAAPDRLRHPAARRADRAAAGLAGHERCRDGRGHPPARARRGAGDAARRAPHDDRRERLRGARHIDEIIIINIIDRASSHSTN